MLTAASGRRAGVRDFILLITAGVSNNRSLTLVSTQHIRINRITIHRPLASGMRSSVIGVSVCLLVCLSACVSHKPHVQISPNFLHNVLPVPVARSSSDVKLRTSGLVDDVMFLYNAGNRPESKTTRIFRQVRKLAAPVGRQTALFGRDRNVLYLYTPGEKFAVSDCIWLSLGLRECRKTPQGNDNDIEQMP